MHDVWNKVQETRCKIHDVRYKVHDTRYKLQDTSYKIRDVRYKVQHTRYVLWYKIQKNPRCEIHNTSYKKRYIYKIQGSSNR